MTSVKDLELKLMCRELLIQQMKHRKNLLITRIEDARKYYKEEMNSLLFVNDYKKEELPIRYYMDEGCLEFIDYIMEELK